MTKEQLKPLNILIVDDDESFAHLLSRSLQRRGHFVETCSSGNAALKLLHANKVFDSIISDVRMPNGDGIDLLHGLKDSSLETPVVLLVSGFSDVTTKDAIDHGAAALFGKPVNIKGLEAALLANARPMEAPSSETSFQVDVLARTNSSIIIPSKATNLTKVGMFIEISGLNCPSVNDTIKFKFPYSLDVWEDAVVTSIQRPHVNNQSLCLSIEFSRVSSNLQEQLNRLFEKNL